MSESETADLARIHANKLADLSCELSQRIQNSKYREAAELLAAVKNEIQLTAGHVSNLLKK